jgi:hypothetical protein
MYSPSPYLLPVDIGRRQRGGKYRYKSLGYRYDASEALFGEVPDAATSHQHQILHRGGVVQSGTNPVVEIIVGGPPRVRQLFVPSYLASENVTLVLGSAAFG